MTVPRSASSKAKGIDIERRFDRAKLAANTVRSSFTKGIAIYDLAGRRVNRPAHGLYIVNGRKILIK